MRIIKLFIIYNEKEGPLNKKRKWCMKMNIFAIDLGNKKIKMKSMLAEYSYPASYMRTDFLSPESFEAHIEIKENQIYTLDENKNISFVWGSALEIYNLPEKLIDTYARSNRMKQKKMQRLIEFTLGRLALDFDAKMSEESPLSVHVMLGVPITDMHKDSDTVSLLKSLFIGKHHIKVNDRDIWVSIASENHISIVPQYMGTLLDISFDGELNPNTTYIEGKLGIVDVGGGTILMNSSNALNLSPSGMENFYGIQTLIKSISDKINSTKLFLIEKLLREGSKDVGYLYRTNRNKDFTKDITGEVIDAIDQYTRFTVAPLLTEAFPDLEDFDCIVMTGGGSSIISKDSLLEEIGIEYFERLVFVSEPEMSNVRGFYKGAKMKWGSNENILGERIIGNWGEATVEFSETTGTLKVYTGLLSTEGISPSINRSEIKEIVFLEPVFFPPNSSALFGGNTYKSNAGAMTSLVALKGVENISTSNVVDMSYMFNGCYSLRELDLSNFETSQVINFSNMFSHCENLTAVNLDSFRTSSVINFDSMFFNCKVLNNLDLSHFDMRSALTQEYMFEGCLSLNNLKEPNSLKD